MAHSLDELGEKALISRVGDVIADAAIEGRMTSGEDPRQAARRVAMGIAAGMLKATRPEIAAHSEDVNIVAVAMARWLGITGQRLEDVSVAARLHDIGKLAIPEEILDKHGPLDPIEWIAIRRHTIVGEGIMVSVPELRGAAHLVRHSHERWDGFGYPDGLLGESIPLGSRIIACADAYAAIRCDRPYRLGSSSAQAIAEIRACAGTQFDPNVVAALEALAGGLRIAADRLRPQRRRASRLLALLLIVGVGASGVAVARSGVIPEPKLPRAAAHDGVGLPPSSAGGGGPAQAPFSVPAPVRRPVGLPGAAGPGGATEGGSTLDSQTSGLGSGSGIAGNHDGSESGASDPASPDAQGKPHGAAAGEPAGNGNGDAKGHGNGHAKSHGQPPGHVKQGEQPSATGGGPAQGNGNPKVKQQKPAKPGKASHPGQGAGGAAPANGNGNAGGNGNANGLSGAGRNGNGGGNGNGAP